MLNMEINRTSEDGLTLETWRFYFDDSKCRLVFTGYTKEQKATKRHGFKVVQRWGALDKRTNTMTLDEVPFDEAIAAQAQAEFVKRLTVVKAW